MQGQVIKLVTIVTESALADPLIAVLKDHGVTGYTQTDVRGEGSRGRRVGEVPGDNQRIEILTSPAVAERIVNLLAETYFPNYAIVAWVSDVVVLRGDKYVAGS